MPGRLISANFENASRIRAFGPRSYYRTRRGWLNQEQQKILEYLQEENRVLKAQLGQRLRLSDEERRRLSAKGKELGRKLLNSVAAIPTRPSRPPSFVVHRELERV